MAKVLTVPLSVEGLIQAAQWLENYADSVLPKKCEELLSKMLREGEITAKIYLVPHIDTGQTNSTIMGYREGNSGMILAGGAAVWVEFGTGVYAPGQVDYPIPVNGIVGHGEYGEGHGADPNGWYYKDKFGEWKHTYGIPASMFMYNTAQMLRRECHRMAKEVFSR